MARKQVKEKKIAKPKAVEQLKEDRSKARTSRKVTSRNEEINQNLVVNDDERILSDKPKRQVGRTRPDSTTEDVSACSKRETKKRKSKEINAEGDGERNQSDKKIKIDEKDNAKDNETTTEVPEKVHAKTNSKKKSIKAKKEKNGNKIRSHQDNDNYDSDVNDVNGRNVVVSDSLKQQNMISKPNKKLKKVVKKDTEQDKSVPQEEAVSVVKTDNTGCDKSDIMSLLMQMEGPSAAKTQSTGRNGSVINDDDIMSDSDIEDSGRAKIDKIEKTAKRKGQLVKKKNMSRASREQNVTREETVSRHFMKSESADNAKCDKNKPESRDNGDEDFVNVRDKKTKLNEPNLVSKLVAVKKRQSRKRKSEDSVNNIADLQDNNSKGSVNTEFNSKKKKKDDKEQNDAVESVKNQTDRKGFSSCTNKSESNLKGKRKTSQNTNSEIERNRTKNTDMNEILIKPVVSKTLTKEPDSHTRKVKINAKKDKCAKSKKSKTIDKLKEEKEIKTENIDIVKEIKERIPSHINDSSDVMSILMHMEGPSTSQGQGKVTESVDEDMMSDSDSEDKMNTEDDSEESEGEWEDVEDHNVNSPKKSQTPNKSVEITLDAPVIYKKRKKKEFDLNDYLKKQVNKYKRELALDMHKVHLLCLVSRGFYLNSICGKESLREQVMSIIMTTRELTNPIMKRHSQGHLTSVLKWMNQEFKLSEAKCSENKNMEDWLTECLQNRNYADNTQYTLLCILVLRYLGFMVRLVMSLQPVPYKQAQKSSSPKTNKKSKTKTAKIRPRDGKSTTKQETKDSVSKNKITKKKTQAKKGNKEKQKGKQNIGNTDSELQEQEAELPGSKRNKRRCSKNLSKGAYKEQDDADIDDVDGDLDNDLDADFKAGDESDSDSEFESSLKVLKKGKGKSKIAVEKTLKQEDSGLSSDSDFEEDSILMRTKPLKKESSTSKNQKVLSSDSDGSPNMDRKQTLKGDDTWLEVYMKTDNKWLSVCSHSKEVTKPAVIRSYASSPVYYVVGIDNNNAIKDVTIRYASEWLTKTRKLRVEDDWWTETLEPFLSEDKERDAAEDKDMQAYLIQCPLPTSISQFKGHPLYILKRHLLKYEALYPNTIVPVGYIRGEPVYSRECCHTLHSRENWLKEGRCVRLKEEPYKYVKSRKRWNDKDTEPKECELFGKWQTEIYMPPPAVDGVIPRNAHGNVEMFQPWMLPGGTVHLKGLPALNRIARKLNLDCAPAMVGWDHHCGYAHPVMDGWIVCEEHKDILLAAWDEEQEIIQEREKEKREKRVYGNWKKLIRGMVIKERLKQRYDQEDMPITAPQSEPTQEPSTSEGEKATDVEQSWPQNRLTKSSSKVGIVEKL